MRPDNSSKKVFTYRVLCSLELQFSFPESEVEQAPGGGERDYSPTDAALSALAKELRETLEANYYVTSFEAYAESDELLGISDEKGRMISNEGND